MGKGRMSRDGGGGVLKRLPYILASYANDERMAI